MNTSKFILDTSGKTITLAYAELPIQLKDNFTEGREYVIELEQYWNNQRIRIYDYLTAEMNQYETKNISSIGLQYGVNGIMCQNYQIDCVSGSFEIGEVEISLPKNPSLVMLGDSVTADNFRVGLGKNYSAIVANTIGDCVITALGGAGSGSADGILENEILKMKPKVCTWHLGINGGLTELQLNNFVTKCQDNDIVPVIAYVLPVTDASKANNTTIAGVIANYGLSAPIRMDIATALNNDPDQGRNPDFFSGTDVHPNESGHAAMAGRFLMDLKL